jgi:NADH-quinone oxidoreductase subunit N
MTQSIDHLALLPAYLAAGTAVLALLADLALARRQVTLAVTAAGAASVAIAAVSVGERPGTLCLPDGGCSYVADPVSVAMAVAFALLTLGVLGLSAGAVRTLPAGEYCFLLASSMTGGVALAYARDLITLIVALETLTLPLYALVGLRRRSLASAQGAVTLFVVSVVAAAVTLLGAALLYAATGAVHLSAIAAALDAGVPAELAPLARAGVVLVLAGLAFKLAAVPFHAWAPAAYDGAPLPVAAYLSTASKLGGVVVIGYVVDQAFWPWREVAGPPLAAFAIATMTVGNLVALRQRRMVRLLAWSSVAQAGYILAPLGVLAVAAGRTDNVAGLAVTAAFAYAIFYVTIELAAFGSVVAWRGGGSDGGMIEQYRGAARRAPLLGAALTLALVGLAGLPPGLAGLFAKVAVVGAILAGDAWWLAVVVAGNVVIGLAYYVRVAARLYAPVTVTASAEVPAGLVPATPVPATPVSATPLPATPLPEPAAVPDGALESRPALPWPVAGVIAAATLLAIVLGFAPQLVIDIAGYAASR